MTLNFTQSIIFTLCLFLHSFAIHGMDLKEPTTRNSKIREASQEYNKTIPLIALHKDVFGHFLQCFVITQPLEESIKNSLSLSTTCTFFNNLLPELGKLHQKYPLYEKNTALEKLLLNMNDVTYQNKRRAALLLVYAGADHNNACLDYPLLQKTVHYNDYDMTTVLFDHNANPNLVDVFWKTPIIFEVQTVEMARLFIEHGVDLHVSTILRPNILWYRTLDKEPDLLKLYLEKGVDPRKIDKDNGSCILHTIAQNLFSEEYVKKAEIILSAIPDMINILNKEGKTPLDYLYRTLNSLSWNLLSFQLSFQTTNAIINLFRKYGAKTVQELKQQST